MIIDAHCHYGVVSEKYNIKSARAKDFKELNRKYCYDAKFIPAITVPFLRKKIFKKIWI